MMGTRHIGRLTCWIAAVLIVAGCEEDVAGPGGLSESYSIYGILNPRLNMQTLLASPVTDLLAPVDSSLDAVVESTDLTTGQVHVWTDSIVANETGQIDHIFWSDFRPDFGDQLRVEVARSDGENSTVEVHIPMLVAIEQEDTGTRNFGVTVLGEDFRIMGIRVIYHVAFYQVGTNIIGPHSSYTFSHSDLSAIERGQWGARLSIDLKAHYETMRSLYFNDHFPAFPGFMNPICDGLGLFDVTISLTIGSANWNPPGGVFEPDILAQPGTLRNVVNGFGFVTGGYNEDAPLYPSTKSLNDTWFFDFVRGRKPIVSGCGR